MDIGVDIVEIDKIEESIKSNDDFLSRIYTDHEIAYCEKKRYKYEHYAGRFAAKEALFKALNLTSINQMTWSEVEIRNSRSGKPKIMLTGSMKRIAREKGLTDIRISLSHCRTHAVAYVIAGTE